MANLSVDSASNLLAWSNVLYVVGAVLTLGSAIMVFYEKRAVSLGKSPWRIPPEIVVLIAAATSLLGTIGAISFGSLVGRLKDAELKQYQTDADKKIASARADAANSVQQAVSAQLEIEKMKPSISTLQADQRTTKNSVQQLQQLSAPRQLALDNSNALPINERLRALNTVPFAIEWEATDSESGGLAHQLAALLTNAGLQVSSSAILAPRPNSPLMKPGVHISYEDREDTRNASLVISKLLKKSGIAFTLAPENPKNWIAHDSRAAVLLVVGRRW